MVIATRSKRLERLAQWAVWAALVIAVGLQMQRLLLGRSLYCFRALAKPSVFAFSVATLAVVVAVVAVAAAIALDWKWEGRASRHNTVTVIALFALLGMAPLTLSVVSDNLWLSSHPCCDDPEGLIGYVSPDLWTALQTPWNSPEYLEHRNGQQLDAAHQIPPGIFK